MSLDKKVIPKDNVWFDRFVKEIAEIESQSGLLRIKASINEQNNLHARIDLRLNVEGVDLHLDFCIFNYHELSNLALRKRIFENLALELERFTKTVKEIGKNLSLLKWRVKAGTNHEIEYQNEDGTWRNE